MEHNAGLSGAEKRRGRRIFNAFAVVNSFSFLLLSGNMITLFALRLGASSALIGVLASFPYVAFFFMVLGKRLVRRFGVVKLFGHAWLVRYVLMLPAVAIPAVAALVNPGAALGLLVVCTLGFHAARGVGMIGESPTMAALSAGRDRGEYVSRFQITVAAVSIVTGLAIAALLGARAPLTRYALFVGAGIAAGFVSAALVYKLPEPAATRAGAGRPLFETIAESLVHPNFARFIAGFAFYGVLTGMGRSFLIVYAKQVYAQSDSMAIFFTVVGSLGAVCMGYLARLLIDRLGAKPIYLFFIALYALSLIPAVIAPPLTGTALVVFLSVLFFFATMGFTGGENSAQVYFFGLVDPRDQLNLGILYFLTLGVGGSAGALLGGGLLDALPALGVPAGAPAFRVFFTLMAAALALVFVFNSRLQRRGARPFRDAFGVMFSIRDLRAMTLLHQLDQPHSISEERRLIRGLGESHSNVSLEQVVERLTSPSYEVRTEALAALEQLPLNREAEDALIDHLTAHEFTTAFFAARIVGTLKVERARATLRKTMYSNDHLLAARSMVALAQIDERRAISDIETVLRVSDHPMMTIHAAMALKQFGDTGSLPVLLRRVHQEASTPYVRDELVLAMVGILGHLDWFFPIYSRFLEDRAAGVDELERYLEEERRRTDCAGRVPALNAMLAALARGPQGTATAPGPGGPEAAGAAPAAGDGPGSDTSAADAPAPGAPPTPDAPVPPAPVPEKPAEFVSPVIPAPRHAGEEGDDAQATPEVHGFVGQARALFEEFAAANERQARSHSARLVQAVLADDGLAGFARLQIMAAALLIKLYCGTQKRAGFFARLFGRRR